ncbi:hypothetical protein [Amycolatopsis thailandensis]|uniref:hypothetical protein n=1 Tax=Amycolatopsis thailandensis TaxID=589330 RepID=UPI001177C5E6|nr:hypothetical protein [Amycolatopsis thailandensis]
MADDFRRQRDGHLRLFADLGKDSDRAYAAGFQRSLHALYLYTFGDYGEPLEVFKARPDEHPDKQGCAHPDEQTP